MKKTKKSEEKKHQKRAPILNENMANSSLLSRKDQIFCCVLLDPPSPLLLGSPSSLSPRRRSMEDFDGVALSSSSALFRASSLFRRSSSASMCIGCLDYWNFYLVSFCFFL